MKLIFLIILLCGITSKPVYTAGNAKAKKTGMSPTKATTVKATAANFDMIPSGLLFQF